MQYNIIDTNNKKYKIISINGKNNKLYDSQYTDVNEPTIEEL